MPTQRFHAFADDLLADHDGVSIADLVRRGVVSAAEVADAARARAARVDPILRAIVAETTTTAISSDTDAPLFGVPTYVKDNTDVRGLPTNYGTAAYVARPSTQDGPYTKQLLSSGMTVLGKSRLPEFGLNASTEFVAAEPTRNPWHTDYSSGASSGGAAALVAAGVVPIAHGNDGGGSIRIPAACCGLVGLKPSRGRHIDGPQARSMPINLVSEGVLTRSVRDTATYFAAAERYWRNPKLPPVGLVEGPARRRLRIGVIADSITGTPTCAQTRAVLDETVTLLEKLGHDVRPVAPPIEPRFVDDFTLYWGLLAFTVAAGGKLAFDRRFRPGGLDGFTRGLGARYRKSMARTPAILYRLSQVRRTYAEMFRDNELILCPVLVHTTPELGYLNPTVPFDELFARLISWVAFTPPNNVAGTPAISLPMGISREGLPIGMQFSAAYGDERTLLEIGFALEAEHPWRRIQD
ncbi:amidase [Nocardia sp. NBC_00565]|uniref:amidase n=1 Tax=Nocardia sp. NBC_00565 TaxID=2975993 RepID=UPI002E80B47D|nr:amidase [Nocardia sp. NBC_00565]WUC05906.1 amidase [Nocardia sp. NBC_00565]